MGAVTAFAKTIEFITKNPKLVLIPLLIALIIAPINAFLFKNYPMPFEGQFKAEKQGNVIVEEYGRVFTEDELKELMEYLRIFVIVALLSALLTAIGEYAVIRGAILIEQGKGYSLLNLLKEGIKNMFQVFAINLVVGIIIVVVLFVALIPAMLIAAAGAFAGSFETLFVLVFLLIFLLEIPLATFLVGAASMAVPIYATKGSISSAFGCFGLGWRNKLSTLGFGALLLVSAILITVIPGSFMGLAFLGSSGFTAQLIMQLLETPFQALIQTVMAIGGLMFYWELTKLKKSLEEEILEKVQKEYEQEKE
jgi:hypothetical protein